MSRKKQSQYDRMTGQPVEKLILELGLPTTISMLVTNLYNMADTYFVGTLGTSASGATGVVFGLMAILQALGFMFGNGREALSAGDSEPRTWKMPDGIPQQAFMQHCSLVYWCLFWDCAF